MVMSEFIDETDKLCEFYEKQLNSYERNVWFEELHCITREMYAKIIRQCFLTKKFMPKLADIIEIKNNLPIEPNEHWEPVECEFCNGTGIITYHKEYLIYKDIKYPYPYYFYGARCICENGKRLSKDIPHVLDVMPQAVEIESKK